MTAYQERVRESLMDFADSAPDKVDATYAIFDIIFEYCKEKEAAIRMFNDTSDAFLEDLDNRITNVVWAADFLTEEHVSEINRLKSMISYTKALPPIFAENFDFYASAPIDDDNTFDIFESIL